jgi:quinoprotein glucose dehydrogenase
MKPLLLYRIARPPTLFVSLGVVVLIGILVTAAGRQSLIVAHRPNWKVEWPQYSGDSGGTKFSSLAEINIDNVNRLKKAWEWSTGETQEDVFYIPGEFQATPIMIDNVLYVSTPFNRVVALNAETGKPIWTFDPGAKKDGPILTPPGFIHRGVAAWRDPASKRLKIFLNSRTRLYRIDAQTGHLDRDFGVRGVVDIVQPSPPMAGSFLSTSPPVIYQNVVIVGSSIPDHLSYWNAPRGDVRAFDARSGALVWTFHTVPHENEFGSDTWSEGSFRYIRHVNVWAPMSVDETLGLVYLPISAATNNYYGGLRLGTNLFANSLVCLRALTGERVWHYQIVHHDVWDYDLAAQPLLVSLRVKGRMVQAVIQLTKMGWAFCFDRLTGVPVWPIKEQLVPGSPISEEIAWPTQPVPTQPAPFVEQGVSLSDAFDYSEPLMLEAISQLKKLRLGPIYTPPSLEGTVMRPGMWGGANWGGGAFDRDASVMYIKTTNLATVGRLIRIEKHALGSHQTVHPMYIHSGDAEATFHDGLPLLKGPYAHVVALNFASGRILWRVPFGDNPTLRNHPALRGVVLPMQIGAVGRGGAIVTRGGVVFVGGGDESIYALNKYTGGTLWKYRIDLPTTGTPMTYRTASGRQFVVVAAGKRNSGVLTAFALPIGG